MSFKVFDGNSVDLIACGLPITDGKAENFVAVRPKGPAYETDIGADGEVTRFPTHERRFDVMIRLKRSSVHNSQLAAVHAADQASDGGAGVGPFLLKDNTGSTIYASAHCWIVQLPEWEIGRGVGDVEWQLEMVLENGAGLPGGN